MSTNPQGTIGAPHIFAITGLLLSIALLFFFPHTAEAKTALFNVLATSGPLLVGLIWARWVLKNFSRNLMTIVLAVLPPIAFLVLIISFMIS